MKTKEDSPGVHIPPPLIFVVIFIVAIFVQKKIYIDDSVFHLRLIKELGVLFLLIAFFFLVASLTTFFRSRNTVVLIKPASSLQTKGVYAISRNPMYVGLLFVYLGMTCFIRNWWNIILIPLLIFIMQVYVIRSEERYLKRAFGNEYMEYRKRVRRWL